MGGDSMTTFHGTLLFPKAGKHGLNSQPSASAHMPYFFFKCYQGSTRIFFSTTLLIIFIAGSRVPIKPLRDLPMTMKCLYGLNMQ